MFCKSVIRNLSRVAAATAMVCVICSTAFAQTTESLTVTEVAPDSPPWMAEIARADDFREPTTASVVESHPYGEARADGRRSTLPVYQLPHGWLTGKIGFAMAGHGWTYDSDRMIYFTQRGLSHGMVEDLGNADQMHIFAHMLLNAGATVVPLRPVDHQPNERIIDNTMPHVTLYGEWRAGTSDRYYGSKHDDVPYVFAKASLVESAVARYRPYIPEAGYYPVYVWARDGADRSNQLYRIAHSGGIVEARVDYRKLGKAWVWLGTYHFEQGTDDYVEVSNQVIDPYEFHNGHVVIADAVRFGNGQGDVPRPGGISGFLREDEGDSYWIERGLGVNADRRIFDVGRDASSTVSSPPKAAAHINRELVGSFLDRKLISFHSNASTGRARGAIALFNASANRRPTYQESLGEILGAEINRQMVSLDTPTDVPWSDRERNTYSGINFGELRRDYIQNEMSATIVESAFHDNKEDVDFLLDPLARIRMTEATMRGLYRWYNEIVNMNRATGMPPARPVAVAGLIESNKIRVKWKAGRVGEFYGGEPTTVRVYRSSNGYGFDGGTVAEATADSLVIDPLTTQGVTFIRLTAANGAGESFPSQTIAVGLNSDGNDTSPRSLHVAINTVLDRSTNVTYKLGAQPGGPYRPWAATERVRALYTAIEPSGRAEALALTSLGQSFDGIDSNALENELVELKDYKRVFFTAEQQNPATPLLSESIQNMVRSHINRDGKVYISGSGIVNNLYKAGGRHRTFVRGMLGFTGEDVVEAHPNMQSMDDRFLPTTGTLSLLKNNRYWAPDDTVQPAVLKLNTERSLGLLKYNYGDAEIGIGAALTRPTASEGEIITLGFPMSLVPEAELRTQLMQAVLKQL